MILTSMVGLFLFNELVSGLRVSQLKCAEYKKMFPTNYYGTGEDAVPKEFPFMARIKNATDYYNGILVSDNFVLSVAYHNFGEIVILGDLELYTDSDDSQPKTYNITNTFAHPDFNKDHAFADIKLYQLNESIKFNEYVRPACLSLKDLSVSEDLIQIGWGPTNIRNNNILHKFPSSYISHKRCKNAYQMAKRQKYVRDIDKKGNFFSESRRGSRRFVTGIGHAVIHDDRNAPDEVIGLVVDFSTSEEANVTVSVRISANIDWIESIVWPNHSTSASAAENVIETKTFPTKFVYLIGAAVLLTGLLCAAIMYFSLCRSKSRKIVLNLQMFNQ